jgi:hypothetical protein
LTLRDNRIAVRALLGALLAATAAQAATVGTRALKLTLSDHGAITSAAWRGLTRALQGETRLDGCTTSGPATRRHSGSGVEFEGAFVCGSNRARVIDRFLPTAAGVRWEIEINGEGAPFSVPIQTRLRYPVTNSVRFWTAWSDPAPTNNDWRDPLQLASPANRRLYYGAPPIQPGAKRKGIMPNANDLVALPLATFSEPRAALSLALALDDAMLDLTLDTSADGEVIFSRLNHRIQPGAAVRFSMDLVPHEPGWRGGLRFLVDRYPAYFNPSDPKAHELAGTSAYSSGDVRFDAARMKAMAFRTNWMASFDFPYMGLFLPPVGETENWERYPGDSRGEYKPAERGRNGITSVARMASYAARMRAQGFHALNYFNVTEFGDHIAWPLPAAKPGNTDWKDPSQFLADHFPAAILLQPDGKPVTSWGGAVITDAGEPAYRAHLLDQARAHLRRFPATDGICIDRMDWLRLYNSRDDDGVSWFEGRPARSLVTSWRQIMEPLTRAYHDAGKLVFVNNHLKRADLLKSVDGIFDEHTYFAASLNTTALLCVRRPMLGWTTGVENLKPDPDAYFQRHIYLGTTPMAPFPGNDHSIAPDAWADPFYLAYGPLMDELRGRTWVLTPHTIAVEGGVAKANLLRTPRGYLVPVMLGGSASEAVVVLSGIQAKQSEILHPGKNEWLPAKLESSKNELRIRVPLARGCAMLRLSEPRP